MSTASPLPSTERLIPLREIPGELARLTAENESLRQSSADWKCVADLTGASLGIADAALGSLKAERSALYSLARDLINTVEDRDCATAVLKGHPTIAMECPECFGRGSFGGPGSLSDDDPRMEMPEVACDECDGVKWVLR